MQSSGEKRKSRSWVCAFLLRFMGAHLTYKIGLWQLSEKVS